MKRIFALLLVLLIGISLVACDSSESPNQQSNYDNDNSYTDYYDDDYVDEDNDTDYDDAPIVSEVCYISNRTVQDDEDGYTFLFSFLDANENEIKSPATVKIKIVNDAGVTVYSATKNVTENDFSTWSNRLSGKSWLQAAIYIKFAEITKGTVEDGKLYYQITSSSGVSFDECNLDVGGLPIKSSTITLPSVPQTIHDYDYDNNIETSVKITNIRYEISGDDLYIYFTGEKTYDDEGGGYSRSCNVGWKLYDSEGYIKDSGTFYSPAIKVGEKFKDEKEYAWDVISPGESYKLVIENVD